MNGTLTPRALSTGILQALDHQEQLRQETLLAQKEEADRTRVIELERQITGYAEAAVRRLVYYSQRGEAVEAWGAFKRFVGALVGVDDPVALERILPLYNVPAAEQAPDYWQRLVFDYLRMSQTGLHPHLRVAMHEKTVARFALQYPTEEPS